MTDSIFQVLKKTIPRINTGAYFKENFCGHNKHVAIMNSIKIILHERSLHMSSCDSKVKLSLIQLKGKCKKEDSIIPSKAFPFHHSVEHLPIKPPKKVKQMIPRAKAIPCLFSEGSFVKQNHISQKLTQKEGWLILLRKESSICSFPV